VYQDSGEYTPTPASDASGFPSWGAYPNVWARYWVDATEPARTDPKRQQAAMARRMVVSVD